MNRVINYFSKWGIHQWVRMAFGLFFTGAYIVQPQWPFILFGAVFILQAFTNTGCRGDSCSL
ncbi:MAG: hypothetical protein HC867_02905 [Bacteroidia bacterium]|nr:hypothetical protein [Bacteroidia bacterium]